MNYQVKKLRNCRLGGIKEGENTNVNVDGEIFSQSEWAELVNKLSLSSRQTEIIKELFSNRSDKQIAGDLQISVPTVRTHLSRLFSKFDVQDRIELILCVFHCFREDCRSNGCSRR